MAYETTGQILAELSDYWRKDSQGNLYKLFDVYNGHMERISDSADKVLQWRAIKDAQGTTLDLFGQDINTPRPTKADDPYRFLIYLKTLLAHAQGTVPSIVKITAAAIGTTQGMRIVKTKYPRHVNIYLPMDQISDPMIQKFLVDNLQHMLALGYWVDTIIYNVDTNMSMYVGADSTDQWLTQGHSKAIWWTGWSETTAASLTVGTLFTCAEDLTTVAK